MYDEATIKRFWDKVDKNGNDGCWDWTAGRSGASGIMGIGKGSKTAHRISWALHFGEPPPRTTVYRRCKNNLCVNPNHLYLAEKPSCVPQGSFTKNCLVCGIEFKVKAERIKRGAGQTCSQKCRGIWTGNKRVTSVEIKCAGCDKAFLRQPNATGGNRCCSRKCFGKWMRDSKSQLKENNSNWRGGSSERTYYGPNWEEQKSKARERDNYQCQRCGISQDKLPKQLDVHHIIPFRIFGFVAGMNDNYLEANKLENLICLCISCHRIVEPNGPSKKLFYLP